MAAMAALATFAARPGAAIGAGSYANWTKSADLIMDTSPSGANVTATVADFPILLRLTADNFVFSEAKGHGQDIRFAKADGKPLAYQIERWDSTKAVAEIWIKADTVFGNAAAQTLRCYWGNPAAADSSNGASVFQNRYVAAWHMGGDANTPRANAVSGGQAAVPVNYDGDESRPGIIGLADSLDGGAPGDYLDIGDGYQDFSSGFMFSVWAYPTAMKGYARFLELGNGESADNIMLIRDSTTDNLRFDNYYAGATVSTVKSPAAIALNQWQHLAVTVTSGGAVKLYRNGAMISSGTLSNSISGNWRASNFLGKSNWAWDGYFQGLLDEPEIMNVPHSDSWVKLCYQNQKANQNLVTLKTPKRCVDRFKAPADTTVAEGANLILTATADCAAGYNWSAVSGPTPRLLDPEVKALAVTMPRVSGDTALVYRFTATYADSSPHKDVRVRIKESIPEPAFDFAANLAWSGKDSLKIRPVVSNLAAMKASPNPSLHWTWTISGLEADTAWLPDGIMLEKAAGNGTLTLGLCLDNDGPPTCKQAGVKVSPATAASLLAWPRASANRLSRNDGRDASGRKVLLSGSGGTGRGPIPLFARPGTDQP